jgi:hypothetical protein
MNMPETNTGNNMGGGYGDNRSHGEEEE